MAKKFCKFGSHDFNEATYSKIYLIMLFFKLSWLSNFTELYHLKMPFAHYTESTYPTPK